MDAELRLLIDRAALHDLMARYAHTVDRRDIPGIVDCFTVDAHVDMDGGAQSVVGRDALARFFETAFESELMGTGSVSTHLLTDVFVGFDDRDGSTPVGRPVRLRFADGVPGIPRWPIRAAPVGAGSAAADALGGAIEAVARDLARQQAADGEGATTLITAVVSGARDDVEARAVARAVVSSSLVKAAAHGRDPNWGRIAGAAGNARLADAAVLDAAGISAEDAARRAGTAARLDPARLRIEIAGHAVFDGASGGPIAFDRAAARDAMSSPEVVITLDLGLGDGVGEAFGCDLTEAYVIENSEYTT
jgi:hypothetical protein